jgi:hypothetical protein
MSLEDALRKCEAWRRDYNEERPHSAIGNKTPIELINRSAALGPPMAPVLAQTLKGWMAHEAVWGPLGEPHNGNNRRPDINCAASRIWRDSRKG